MVEVRNAECGVRNVVGFACADPQSEIRVAELLRHEEGEGHEEEHFQNGLAPLNPHRVLRVLRGSLKIHLRHF
jgi:hypothetical protein